MEVFNLTTLLGITVLVVGTLCLLGKIRDACLSSHTQSLRDRGEYTQVKQRLIEE